jgi:hypothetical protein
MSMRVFSSLPFINRNSWAIRERFSELYSAVKKIFEAAIQPIAAYFVKMSVFREAALQGRCSQYFIVPPLIFFGNLWMRCNGLRPILGKLDTLRLQKSETFLAEFAEIRTLRMPDGARITWALYTPEKFEQWIQEHGGYRDGDRIYPRRPQDWERLKKLGAFKCFREIREFGGQSFQVPARVPGSAGKCVLQCPGFGTLMPMHKASIGKHLAAGFNYALFDWRKNEVSIKGYFADAGMVYQALLQEDFTSDRIITMGTCRATFVVAYLKKQHPRGDVVMIQAPPSLEKTIAHTKWPGSYIGSIGLKGIETNDFHFDSVRHLQNTVATEGATCLIMSAKDKILPPNSIQELQQAAQVSGHCELIVDEGDETAADPHFSDPLDKPEILQRYFAFLAR